MADMEKFKRHFRHIWDCEVIHPIFSDKVCEIVEKTVEMVEQERRWIPVSERLPKREQIPFDCLVALKSGTVHEATFLDVDPVHRWCTELHYFNTGDVIAWMPLPQPPKEGDGE